MEFKLADIFTDANLLKTVSGEVEELLREDPELLKEENGELKKRLGSISGKKLRKAESVNVHMHISKTRKKIQRLWINDMKKRKN